MDLLFSPNSGWSDALSFWNSLDPAHIPTQVTSAPSSDTPLPDPIEASLVLSYSGPSYASPSTAPLPRVATLEYPNSPWLLCSLLNTRSLVKHGPEVADYIAQHSLDIMFISESWLHEASADAASLAIPENYSMLRNDRVGGIGGGVACIYNNALNVHQIPNVALDGCEYIFLKISLDYNTSLSCIVLYRPPHDLPKFKEQLTSLISCHLKPSSFFLLCGDFNHWANDPTDTAGVSLLADLSSLGFTQHVSSTTHSLGNTLDWVLTFNISPPCISISPCPWSDHHFVDFYLPLKKLFEKPIHERLVKPCRNIRKLSIPKLRDSMITELDQLLTINDVDLLATSLRTLLNTSVDALAPVKHKVFKTETTNKPWFDNSIITARTLKRRAEVKWRRNPDPISKAAYSLAARDYKIAITAAKSVYYDSRINSASSSSKELFRIVRELEGSTASASLPVASDSWCQTLQDSMLSKINRHVEAIETRIALFNTLPPPPSTLIPDPPKHLNPCFQFHPVSVEEVSRIVSSMKPTAYKGDIFTADIIQKSLSFLAPVIASLVNLSFATSRVPSALKESLVTPLLKKAGLDAANPLHYRPITNVCFLLKIIDRIAYGQIQAFLESTGLLNPRQSGFRRGYGTESALLDLKTNLAKIVDSGDAALLLLLDLSAAFDLVDHSLLIKSLSKNFFFSKEAAEWVNSFLANRSVRVVLGESSASPAPLVRGVPQGACLSPTLYNMYTCPLFDALDQLGVGFTNYADDTQIFLSLSGIYAKDLAAVQSIFSAVQRWMAYNKLALNNEKTELLLVGSRQKLISLSPLYSSFSIEGHNIPTVSVVKTLGVHLDSNLSMSKHVSKTKSSCAYSLKLINNIKKYLSKVNLGRVAGALINSRVDYCNSLLAGSDAKHIHALQVVQNNAVRVVSGLAKHQHVSAARRELHWLPVEQRVTHKILTLTHKCLNNKAPDYLCKGIHLYNPGRTLRSSTAPRLLPPRFKLARFGGRSFPVVAANHWNSLPCSLKNLDNFEAFKKQLKTHLFGTIT